MWHALHAELRAVFGGLCLSELCSTWNDRLQHVGTLIGTSTRPTRFDSSGHHRSTWNTTSTEVKSTGGAMCSADEVGR